MDYGRFWFFGRQVKHLLLSLGVPALILLDGLPATGQINTGKVTGIVTDSAGAVVPGAKASAVNEQTGVSTTVRTLDTGSYLINFLIPGQYTVEIEAQGFGRTLERGVEVTAGGTARIDFSLHIGQLQQSVEVQANPLAVNTESAELSQTFGYKALDELPNIDRNPLYQMNLMPGANNGSGSGNYGSNGGENGSAVGLTRPQLSSIGGVDANANGVYIEGIFNREPQNAYVGLVPPIEGVQEVQVFAGKYDAEYGFSGSAVINVVTKSGTNEFHGAAFEFLRNNATDANNYFSSQSTPFRRNQFGGAVGGPIRKNKLFFFADYQGTLFRTSNYEFTSAPTAKMYNGDFSELYSLTPPAGTDNASYAQLYDPFSRRFDQNGNVLSAAPFAGNVIPSNRFDSAAAKMNTDHVFGVANLPGLTNNLYYLYRNTQDSHQADGRVDFNQSDKQRLFFRYSILDSTNGNSTDINQFFQDGQANSHSLNQNLELTLFSTFGPSQANEARIGYNRTHVNTATNSMDKNWNNFYGIPNGNLGDPITQGIFELSSLPPFSNFGQPDWVAFIVSNTIAATDNYTWVKGRHTFKVGVNLNHVEDTSADTIGGDDPRGALSFDPAMTSLNGVAPPFAYPSFLLGAMTSSARARFVNGWPYQTYWQNAFYAQDDFKVLPSLTLNLGFRYELTTRPVERYNRQSNWDTATNQLVVATSSNRSPALNLDKGDVGPRVGLAWSPDKGKTSIRAGFGISYWQAYWTGPLTILGLGYPNYAKQQLLSSNNLTPNLLLSRDGLPLASAEYDSAGKLIIPANAVIRGTNRNWKSQEVAQTSVNVEREVFRGLLADVGYLRVRGLHNNHTRNINQAPPQPQGVDYNLARPLAQQYPQLGDIPIQYSNADSWYDAFTARLVARPRNGLTLSASYAHGRTFANGNNIDQKNINQYYGPTQQDIAHIFTAQFSYELPVGRGKQFLSDANRLVDALLGGWQYSGFVTVRSGLRFDVRSDISLLNNGQGNRPNRLCTGTVSNPNVNRWFDTSCFIDDLTVDSYGNAGINPLHTDGLQQLDSSLFKTFKITERTSVEFRADAFNTFNHPNFSAPNATVGDPSEGMIFGTSLDNRRMQFGLRLFF
jgi:Carboxypeptidase regulatory-like domain